MLTNDTLGLLKRKMERDGTKPGESFVLKTMGNPLTVRVGVPKNKTERKNVSKLSFGTIMEISNILNLSKRKTKLLCKSIRNDLGRNMVEPNILEQMADLHEELNEFYDVKEEMFLSGESDISRNLVYVKDTSDIILHIIQERGLDPHRAVVKIAVDSGQSMLKCVLNVFDPEETYSTSTVHEDSGVKRSIILSLVEDVSESNFNLRKLLDPLKLNDVDYKIAFDLKAGNALFGLSSHSGKYSCLWCDGESSLECGQPRTLKSIDQHYFDYVADGEDPKKMKHFKNCIHPRVIYNDMPGETSLVNLVPIPELHVFIGITSLFVKVLLPLWSGFGKWLEDHYIMYRNYHGIGLDGNNSKRFLNHLNELETAIHANSDINPKLKHLVKVIECLRTFSTVKEKAFGNTKLQGIEEAVERFKNSFEELQYVLRKQYNFELRTTWKVHILVCHLSPFLATTRYGLGVFSEQAGESAHYAHKQKWTNYKRRITHEEHGIRLKKSVVDFGIHNLK